MPKQIIKVLVEGGKATPGPPLGPTLSPMKINVGQVVTKINEKTKEMAGMQVPISVVVDPSTKAFEIEVGTPPVAALVKKELKIEKGSGEAGKRRAGDLTDEQVRKVARLKFGSDADQFYTQVKGTARSMGITVGQGAVTEEEIRRYEEMKKAEEAAKEAAKAAAAGLAAAPAAEEAEKKAEEGKEAAAPKKEEKKQEKKR